ncbi:MAG TPA: FtsX-like permease family protein [Vicinamibacterales bacterium]|nr:FtsX-like permease family protein [Vicinamibacterales bacterium]
MLTDLRRSARGLVGTPGVTLALVLTIAIGIGCTAAVHGFVRGLSEGIVSRRAANQMVPASDRTLDAAEMSAAFARADGLLRAATDAVFFIACANVALLLLARGSARAHETATRVALGCGRHHLARQLFADSLLISLAGGAAGVVLAVWTVWIVPALFFEEDARQLTFAPDVRAIAAACAACVAVTIACGLLPLLETRWRQPAIVLQRETAGPSRAMHRLRRGLVIAQLACGSLLIVAAMLLMRGFRSALETSAGRRLEQTIVAIVEASSGFTRADAGARYFQDVERAVATLPHVATTAWAARLPGSRSAEQSMRVDLPATQVRDVVADAVAFTRESLAQVAARPVAGRMFAGVDTPDACRVVLVNVRAAEIMFAGDAVGRAIVDSEGKRLEIVGVVGAKPPRKDEPPQPAVYYYAEQAPPPFGRGGQTVFHLGSGAAPATAALDTQVVSPGYFESMGFSLDAGRVFPDVLDPEACRVAVINREAAERDFGGHAVGSAVIDRDGHRTEIVGVVRSPVLRASQRPQQPAIYLPMSQHYLPRMTLIIGVDQANDAAVGSVRRQIEQVSGGEGAVVMTLNAHLARSALAPDRLAAVLVVVLTGLGVTLGMLGVQGALAESAHQRQREIALRLALGARGWRVIRQMIAECVRLAGAGITAGSIGSVIVARWLMRITPDAGPPGVRGYLAAALVVAGEVAIGCVLPARRALAVDPLSILSDR